MYVLIAGGGGFLGGALARGLRTSGHKVKILTRRRLRAADEVHWDGRTEGAWTQALDEADAVVNACGYGLDHWPWTSTTKRRFMDSRVLPGRLLTAGLKKAKERPRVLVQFSGVNHYGFRDGRVADETTPAADDFLARITVEWEAATGRLEGVGVRRIVARNAVVFDEYRGLFPLMCLPARLFLGGRLGGGNQVVPWIHLADHVNAVRFLLENPAAQGAYNLVAPEATSNAELMQAVCRALGRPYWLHLPMILLRVALGEMGSLVLYGRPSRPRRLLEAGFEFSYPTIGGAVEDLLVRGTSRGGTAH